MDHPELYTANNLSFSPPNGIPLALQENVFRYAKENMALVNVYIKDPVVTRIKRDQKITIIGFVANTGGLLGLCMGFSLISAFEILFHFLISIKKVYLYIYGHLSRSLDAIWKYRPFVRHSTIPPGPFCDIPVHPVTGEKTELNSVTSVVTKAMADDSSLVVIPHQSKDTTDKQNIQIRLQNSVCKSGLVSHTLTANHEGYNEYSCKTETCLKEDGTVIDNISSLERVGNHTTSELPIRNIRPFLSVKPKRIEKCNKIKTKNIFPQKVSRKSNYTSCCNNTKYIEVSHNGNGDGTTNSRVCTELSPQKVKIILPPRAYSETSSVNSSRESLAVVQSIKLQNENLSFHYDIENFSHIDETDNEEDAT